MSITYPYYISIFYEKKNYRHSSNEWLNVCEDNWTLEWSKYACAEFGFSKDNVDLSTSETPEKRDQLFWSLDDEAEISPKLLQNFGEKRTCATNRSVHIKCENQGKLIIKGCKKRFKIGTFICLFTFVFHFPLLEILLKTIFKHH